MNGACRATRQEQFGCRLHSLVALAWLLMPALVERSSFFVTLQLRGQSKPARHRSQCHADWLGDLQKSFSWLGSGTVENSPPAAAWEMLPCNTEAGLAILARLKNEGEDSFVAALQSELLNLRRTPSNLEPSEAEDSEAELRMRMSELRWREQRQQVFADLLHLGAVHRLRGEGLTLVSAPLGEQLGDLTLSRALGILPDAVAVEVQSYVLSATSSLNESAEPEVSRTNFAPLLMGAALYGYFLEGAAKSVSAREIAALANSDWDSPAAFVVMSARIGHLLELPTESSDPLQQYASLTAVTTSVQTVQRGGTGGVLGRVGVLEGGLLKLRVECLRGLLGEMCAFGFIMRFWERKIAKFVFPE